MTYNYRLLKATVSACILSLCLFGLTATADTVKTGGTGSAMGSIALLAATYELNHPNTKIATITGLGSSGSIKAVAAGALDISLSARPLKATEQNLNLSIQEIARTPLVLASRHTHTGFTTSDLSKIFDGRLATWPDHSALRPILRPDTDTESALLRTISPDIDRALSIAYKRPGVHVAITDQDSADAIEKIPGAVGITTLALILGEQRKLNALPFNGIKPSVSNLAQGRYPYYKPLYLITAPQPSEATQAFKAFILSKQGAKILSDIGYHLVP